VLGRNVVIGPNAVIGYEGFGFLPDGRGGIRKVYQAGGVVIGDGVEIGAGSCVDRGTIGNTVIGDNSKLDNQVQVGHNAKIGKNVIIAAQTGLAGSTHVKDGAMLGGQVGVADHLVIGAGAMVGAKSGVTKDVEPGQKVSGYPAMPRWQWLKVIARLKK
jgi:UDP-3-O-[3-hydroxymyristoyl] glucosamine N-acyltransferase